MNKHLELIKEEFSSYTKDNQAHISKTKHKNLEILTLSPIVSEKNKSINIDFCYMVEEEGLDVRITYSDKSDKKNTRKVNYAFSSYNKGFDLPNIDKDVISVLNEMFEYEVIEGKLKSKVKIEKQIENFVMIIKNSWNLIINHLNELFK